MNKIALMRPIVTARILQLYYHYCHNLVAGSSFFADHEFFNQSYNRLEEDYDKLAEYYICSFGAKAFETKLVTKALAETLEKIDVEDMSPEDMFEKALELEQKFYKDLQIIDKDSRIGLRNIIGDVSEQSDIRMYKMQQRLNKDEE